MEGLDLHLGVDKRGGFVGRALEAFWEPGGDVIHYQAANNLADRWSRFLVVMLCAPGQEMLVYVDDEELERRRDRRAPRPVS